MSAALFTGAALWGSCARQNRPLAVEYAGCRQVFFPGPVCTLGRRTLWLWVPLP